MDHNGSIYLGPSEKPGKPPGFPRRNCGVAPFPSAAPSGAAPPGSGRPGPGIAFWPVGFPWIHFLFFLRILRSSMDFHWLSNTFHDVQPFFLWSSTIWSMMCNFSGCSVNLPWFFHVASPKGQRWPHQAHLGGPLSHLRLRTEPSYGQSSVKIVGFILW